MTDAWKEKINIYANIRNNIQTILQGTLQDYTY
jgi:hypothetical protein